MDLKFRIWHKKGKTFLNPYYCAIKCNSADIYLSHLLISGNLFSPYRDSCYSKDDVIITQFTGLKDKDKKDIYEGDIVNIYNEFYKEGVYYDRPQYEATNINKKVIFSDGTFSIFLRGTGFRPLSNFVTKIIGNIFENPELLNK